MRRALTFACAALLELAVVFPSDGNDPKLFGQALADFNAVTAGLKVDGRNKFDRPVKAETFRDGSR